MTRTDPPEPSAVDPRVAAVEPALSRGDWAEVLRLLKDTEGVTESPLLLLIATLAERELGTSKEGGAAAHQRAIRATAALLQVPIDSATALLITKRLLRRPPITQKKANTELSIAVLAAGLALGGGAGWLATKLLF